MSLSTQKTKKTYTKTKKMTSNHGQKLLKFPELRISEGEP